MGRRNPEQSGRTHIETSELALHLQHCAGRRCAGRANDPHLTYAPARCSTDSMRSRCSHLISSMALLGLLTASGGCRKPSCPKGSVLVPAATFEMGTSKEVFVAWQLKPRKVT